MEIQKVRSLPETEMPFEKMGEQDTYWGYAVWTDPGPTYEFQVWAQNPRLSDAFLEYFRMEIPPPHGAPFSWHVDYDGLWTEWGERIPFKKYTETDWIDDLHAAILIDMRKNDG